MTRTRHPVKIRKVSKMEPTKTTKQPQLGPGERCQACEDILAMDMHNPEAAQEWYEAGNHLCSKRPPATAADVPALDLPAIKARCEAATEGPWREGTRNVWFDAVPLCIARTDRSWLDDGVEHYRGPDTPQRMQADAAFIAHARTDIPALVARIEELETIVRLHLTECAHCGCSLYLPGGPPHCHDCLVDEDDETRWNEARALLGGENNKKKENSK
jgi:hypothetical protein